LSAARLSAFDAVEGLHLAHALAALTELGVFDALLRKPRSARALAQRLSLDEALLRATLAFVAARTDLVERDGDVFRATDAYDVAARFQIELYAGAFAPNAAGLAASLVAPRRAGAFVDRRRHAQAFAQVPVRVDSPVAAIVLQMDLAPVLDLGCGPGSLLLALALQDSTLRAWGIDVNAAMCRVARERMREAGVSRRVTIVRGDSRETWIALPERVRSQIRLLVAGDVANEWFASGAEAFVAWLKGLRATFPERVLVVADYYGRLGTTLPADRQTLLHDFAQAISGQGIPAATREAWDALYRSAGCRLAHCVEDETTTRFVHIVAL
jgi:SAM-dependent methyltransferase